MAFLENKGNLAFLNMTMS